MTENHALPPIAVTPPVDDLLAGLHDSRPDIRNQALAEIVRVGDASVPMLQCALGDKNAQVRELAVHALKEIGSESAFRLLAHTLVTELDGARAQKRRWILGKIYRGALALAVFLMLDVIVSRFHHGGLPQPVLQVFVQALLVGSLVDASLGLRREAATALAATDDVRMIGVLALCLREKDTKTRQAAAAGLLRLLPRARGKDAKHITPDAMQALLRGVEKENRKLALAIIGALTEIGDQTALPLIERIASGQYYAWDDEIYIAAKECLPALRQRVEETRLSHRLLRPSAAPVEPESTLLRPAGSAPTNTDQLLHPAAQP